MKKIMLNNHFKKSGNYIFLIGDTKGEFGGSLFIQEIFNKIDGKISNLSLEKELSLWSFILESNNKRLLESAKDLSMGGLAIALGKMSAVSDKGISVFYKFLKIIIGFLMNHKVEQ